MDVHPRVSRQLLFSMLSNDRLAFACGTGSRPLLSSKPAESIPNIAAKIHAEMRRRAPRQPPAKILHGRYGYSCGFCYWSLTRPLFDPRPSPVRQRPRRRRRTSNARKCSINATICSLAISSPLALFWFLPSPAHGVLHGSATSRDKGNHRPAYGGCQIKASR
jgi:hypothetical protein